MPIFSNNVRIKPGLLLLLVFCLYLIPLRWLLSWFTAVAVHEFSHIIAIKAAGVKIKGVCFCCSGAMIETEPMKPWQEAVSAIAGPVGGYLLVFTGRYFPCCAVCAFIQSTYNLLPVYPLDGGRVLRCLLCTVLGEDCAEKICRRIGMATVTVLVICLLWCCYMLSLGVLPMVVIVLAAVRLYQIKFPCKRFCKIVQ